MAEDLQTMVDRMTLDGGVEGPDVSEIAFKLEERLQVSLGPAAYVQLADQLIRLSLNRRQQEAATAGYVEDTSSSSTSSNELPSGGQQSQHVSSPPHGHSNNRNHYNNSSSDNPDMAVQPTWSTESVTSSEEPSYQSHHHPNGNNENTNNIGQTQTMARTPPKSNPRSGHEMDNAGAAQPNARSQPALRSPLRPPPSGTYSPMRRPRPASRSSSRTRNVRPSPASRARSDSHTGGVFDPFDQTPPAVTPTKIPPVPPFNHVPGAASPPIMPRQQQQQQQQRQPESPLRTSFAARSESPNRGDEMRPNNLADNMAKGARISEMGPMGPTNCFTRAESPQPTTCSAAGQSMPSPARTMPSPRAPSPAKDPPSSPGLNSRPGLQEDDASGIAESPQAKWAQGGPGGRPAPRREDKGAGAATAAPPRNFSPAQTRLSVQIEEPVEQGGGAAAPDTVEDRLPTPTADHTLGPDPMDMSLSGDMFTPASARGFSTATFAKKTGDSSVPFKTGPNKNRRKGASGKTPAHHGFTFDPVSGTATANVLPTDSPKSSTSFESNSTATAAQYSSASTFAGLNLEQPSLAHNVGAADESSTGGFGASFHGVDGSNLYNNGNNFHPKGSRKSSRRVRRAGAHKTPASNLGGNVGMSSEGPTVSVVPPSGSSDFSDTMEIDPLTPASSSSAPMPESKFSSTECAGFQLGVGGNSRSTKSRSFGRTHAGGSATASAAATDASSLSGRSLSQEAVEMDYSDVKNHIAAIKERARDDYLKGNYGDSIRHYTAGIKKLTESPAKLMLGDTLAVLHSNRAAALMMIGAFDVSACDCLDGLQLVSSPTENGDHFSSDSGPPLRVKLLTRLARSHVKCGEHESALARFEEAIAVSREAIDLSLRFHSPVDHVQHKALLEQMIGEATLGKSEAHRLRDAMEKASTTAQQLMQQQGSSGRRSFADALGHINTAMAIASGSLYLQEAKVHILGRMKRWREVVGCCERLAASHSRMGGVFMADLEAKNPFPVSSEPQYLAPDFFGDAREEDAETAELKLNSKAAAEAVFWLPSSMISTYLRALRLEERYPAAEACLAALKSFVETGTDKLPPDQLHEVFSWLPGERNKLDRTKIGREKGDELFRGGDYELAAARYSNCLTIDSEGALDSLDGPNAGGRLHAVLHCNRAACLMAMKRHKDALEECSAALQIHSRYMKAMLRRARCFTRLGRHQEAISEYKRWLDLVEEAKRTPNGSSAFVAPCLFDGPKDVKPENVKDVNSELEGVYTSKRRAEAAAREEATRRQERQQRWQNEFASSSTSSWGDNDTAQQRREQWQNQHGYRRWDSFSNKGPRSQSTGPRTRSSSWRADAGDSGGQNGGARRQRSVDRIVADPSDHYSVLAVGVQASDAEIKKAYKKMALKFHPDKNKDPNAEDTFRKIQNAYETLSDPKLRIEYNSQRGYHRRH